MRFELTENVFTVDGSGDVGNGWKKVKPLFDGNEMSHQLGQCAFIQVVSRAILYEYSVIRP